MKIQINIQNIKNNTIAKLTADEIGELGLVNYGVMTYKGQLKSRVKGYKTERVGDSEVHFIDDDPEYGRTEFQFIRIDDGGDETEHWAMRIYSGGLYFDSVYSPLNGLRFFR